MKTIVIVVKSSKNISAINIEKKTVTSAVGSDEICFFSVKSICIYFKLVHIINQICTNVEYVETIVK